MELYAHQRLLEEMGFDCDLRFVKTFHYRIDFQNGMIENEIDHIFLGVCDATPEPNPDEVCEWSWVTLEAVCRDVSANPEIYTYWFRYIIENHLEVLGEIG